MKQFIRKQVLLIVAFVMILLLLLNLVFEIRSNRKMAEQEASLMISQIEKVMTDNEKDLNDLMDSLKDEYIIRAKAASYMIENELPADPSISELYKIANLLQIDEIHLFDAAGMIYTGTHPEYYGYSFDSGEQMAFFKPMLRNQELALCQDVTPNTAEGKSMMYALVWREDRQGMVQIGVEPTRLLEESEKNELSYLFSKMPVHPGTIMYAVDKATNTIIGSTSLSHVGRQLEDICVLPSGSLTAASGFHTKIDGANHYCLFHEYNGYYIAFSQRNDIVYSDVPLNMIFVLLYLTLAGVVIIAAISYYMNKDQKNEKKNNAVLEAVGYGLTSYQIIDWDTEEILGYSIEDKRVESLVKAMVTCPTYSNALYSIYSHFIPEESRDAVLQQLSIEAVRKEILVNKQYTVPHIRLENGEITHVQFFFARVNEDYGRNAFILSSRNIDSVVEKERQQQNALSDALEKAHVANRSKTNFLFNMSHDIRTPMNAILGFSNMAEKYIDDKPQALDSLRKLNNAGQHLQRLINDVLDMARIESGKVEFNLQPYPIPALMANKESIFKMEMEKKGIDFSVHWDIQDEIAYLDLLRIEQVELNLISNALKYTPSGGKVTYTVTQIGRTEDGYATYEAVVKDTGIGMSQEFLQHAFETFERERSSTLDRNHGAGLGLSITKHLVEQMGGTIFCESEQGKGSTFTFIVSLRIGTEEDLNHLGEKLDTEVDFTNKRILLVEDNELNREIAEDILSEYGFLIETAEDGIVAVDKVSHSTPGYYDLVLMDIQMPLMDGYKATQTIRSLKEPALANIPIIAMTANAFEEDRQNAFAVGMNEHIAKPLDVPKMIETLQKILR